MTELLIQQNFEIIKNWDGKLDLIDLIKPGKQGSWVKRCLDELNSDIYLRMHPLLLMFAKKGYRHVDVIRIIFNETVENFSNVMKRLLNCMVNLNLINEKYISSDDYESHWYSKSANILFDSEWLKEEVISDGYEGYTNGDTLAIIIGTGGESSHIENIIRDPDNLFKVNLTQLFVFLFFINNGWYRELKLNTYHGSDINRYSYFVKFFKEHINLDLIGVDNEHDMDIRSNIISSKYESLKVDEITLIDVYGCMLRRILENTLENNNLQLRLYETEFENYIWHQFIFPKSSNITYDFDIMKRDNNIIYLNFNDINDNEDDIINFTREFKSEEEKRRIIISFPINQVYHKYLYTLVPFFENEMRMIRPSNLRNDLVTYFYP